MSSESACSATVVSVCGMERIAEQERRIIYSFGINGESLFEAALLERVPGREAWRYELPWTFGPEIENIPNLKERAHFFPWALGGRSAHGTDNSPKYCTLDALM